MGADSGINVLNMSIFTWCFGDIVVFSVVGVTLWVLDDGAACYSGSLITSPEMDADGNDGPDADVNDDTDAEEDVFAIDINI